VQRRELRGIWKLKCFVSTRLEGLGGGIWEVSKIPWKKDIRMMLAKEFLEELKTVHQYFNWSCSRINRKIRGRLRANGKSPVLFDPIGAVCYVKTRKVFSENEWIEAADAIGLSLIAAGDLIAASNNIKSSPELGNQTQKLRKLIVNALTMKPEPNANDSALADHRLRLSRIS